MKTYYKAISRPINYDNPTAIDAVSYNTKSWRNHNHWTIVTYPPNQWVNAPKDTMLFVFDTFENACKVTHHTNIRECHAEGIRSAPEYGTLTESDYELYWQVVNKARKQRKSIDKALNVHNYKFRYPWPEGTLWCKSVKLLKICHRIY